MLYLSNSVNILYFTLMDGNNSYPNSINSDSLVKKYESNILRSACKNIVGLVGFQILMKVYNPNPNLTLTLSVYFNRNLSSSKCNIFTSSLENACFEWKQKHAVLCMSL